jgi:hypothetical protein
LVKGKVQARHRPEFLSEIVELARQQPVCQLRGVVFTGSDCKELPRNDWKIVLADSEELGAEDGNANNIMDLQSTAIWHTEWKAHQPGHLHQVVMDLGSEQTVSGVRYLPRPDQAGGVTPGRIKECRLATDGLGQQVVIKGLSSEGHDCANTDYAAHWNERAGGLKDFTVLLEHAHECNARIGIGERRSI